MATAKISYVQADGIKVFYRSAGAPNAPTVLLLHGYPSSSHMFRNLIPLLAAKGYRVVAPDLPGFGFTEVPPEREYAYTFANLATTLGSFADALSLTRFAIYIFDYGSPTGLRLALERPGSIAAVVTQNGNAYTEGFGRDFWAPVEAYWASGSGADRDALRPALELPATRWQYTSGGGAAAATIPPESYHLDQALLERPGSKEVQLDLLYDYRTNVALYPAFQRYFRESGVPVLAAWGRGDSIFVPAGAEAFARDVAGGRFELRWLEAGHFALEGNEVEMAGLMDAFFNKQNVFGAGESEGIAGCSIRRS